LIIIFEHKHEKIEHASIMGNVKLFSKVSPTFWCLENIARDIPEILRDHEEHVEMPWFFHNRIIGTIKFMVNPKVEVERK